MHKVFAPHGLKHDWTLSCLHFDRDLWGADSIHCLCNVLHVKRYLRRLAMHQPFQYTLILTYCCSVRTQCERAWMLRTPKIECQRCNIC